MTPHKQLNHHQPELGIIGDCWRTAIACLLDKHPSEVPHFCEHDFENTKAANDNCRAYLATQGLAHIEYAMPGDDLDAVLNSVAAQNPGLLFILGGNSRTGCGHVVICRDGEIVWDPSLTNAGIVGPMNDGFYWVTWLVPGFLKGGSQ